jgi:hypothetical protein
MAMDPEGPLAEEKSLWTAAAAGSLNARQAGTSCSESGTNSTFKTLAQGRPHLLIGCPFGRLFQVEGLPEFLLDKRD